ncbi:Fe-S cluster assembly protein SufB [Alkaliphilus crotonatoxidans]
MSKTQVEDIDFSRYDMKNEVRFSYKSQQGLNREIVEAISHEKNEPQWMRDLRLRSLDLYLKKPVPTWGPDLSNLNLDEIVTYLKPDTGMKHSWEAVPDDIKDTFEKLGIPKAEREALAGVGAQYDSEVIYHNMRSELAKEGVVFLDMETALREYEEMVKAHFMTRCVPPGDHKFAALHGAVWSGGSFVYVPPGVKVEIPLQAYFRMNAPGSGQFEHTLIIVDEGAELHFIEGCSAPQYSVNNLHAGCVELFVRQGARLRYSTIENWSRNTYNLNTKRAIVEKDGIMEWVSGSFGSRVSMLYPSTILKGEGARVDHTQITFASKGQYLDTGSKVIHLAPNTTSRVVSKSISKNGGVAFYRGLLKVAADADGCKANVECESLMLDNESRADTLPTIDLKNDDIDIGHEAKIGRISEEQIYYLMSRGITEDEAKAMIVRGFVEPIAKELPLEYAVEMNRLIQLELEGAIG